MQSSCQRFLELLLQAGQINSAPDREALQRLLESPDGVAAEEWEQLTQRLADSGQLTEFQQRQWESGKLEELWVGDYLLTDVIDRGGMGMVYRGVHCLMHRTVAIKFTLSDSNESRDAERFMREVEAASKLGHENIVAALDAGMRGDACYLVMEYVDGRNLYQRVQQDGPLPFAVALDLTLQAARGLEFAHRKKVVHRDIKPNNLLVGSDGVLKILDMGLARMELTSTDGSAELDSFATIDQPHELTSRGELLGTIDFMAPEQAADPRDVDGRADLYGLGCTVYFLLTGAAPYRRDGMSLMERIIAHREQPVPRLGDTRQDIPLEFEDVIQRMLAKKREQRYESATALIGDLERLQRRIGKAPAELPRFVPSPPRPRSALRVVGVASLLLAMLISVVWFVGRLRDDRSARPFVLPPLPTDPKPQPPQSLNLLAEIWLPRDVVAGDGWDLTEHRLLAPPARPAKLAIRITPPPQFILEMTVVRASEPGPLVIGVNEPGRRFFCRLGVPQENETTLTSLGTRDGRMVVNQQSDFQFPKDQPVKLQFKVSESHVSIHCEDAELLAWEGDFAELAVGAGWGVGEEVCLFIGCNEASYEITHLMLHPISIP
ncbi:MAG: serine/threonine protein kinase [Planctomycetales bacterium]|nr:serine/threonine protein kinase [Planctomycetales bacterium]